MASSRFRWAPTASQRGRQAISESVFFSFGVALRFCAYGCVFSLVGVVVLRAIARRPADFSLGDAGAAWREPVERDLALCGMAAGFLLAGFDLGRAWYQTYSFYGGFEPISFALIKSIVDETLWGSGWKLQTISAAAAGAAFAAAYRTWPGAWIVAYPAVILTTISRPLTGHAVEQGSWFSLPAILQAIHVLAAATWIGTLAAVVFIGLRHAARLEAPFRARAVAGIVVAFSPVGLSAVTALFVAGTATAFLYLGSAGAIFGTTYGRVLLAKVLVFAAVAAAGFFNWQRVRPALEAAAGAQGSDDASGGLPESLLWRSAGFELALAVAVLAITAALVALPMPMG